MRGMVWSNGANSIFPEEILSTEMPKMRKAKQTSKSSSLYAAHDPNAKSDASARNASLPVVFFVAEVSTHEGLDYD